MDRIKIEKLSEQQKKALNIPDAPKRQGPWSVWECDRLFVGSFGKSQKGL